MTKERPDDLTERELWGFQQAEQNERTINELRSYYDGWLERGRTPVVFKHCLEIALKIEAYEQINRNLRQPYYARKEHEAYRDAGLLP